MKPTGYDDEYEEPAPEALEGGVGGEASDALDTVLLDLITLAARADALLNEADEHDFRRMGPRLRRFLGMVEAMPRRPVAPKAAMGFKGRTKRRAGGRR